MRVIMFQPRFHGLIRSEVKRSTIRKSARCKPGDELSLRAWSGKAYRSKQIELRPAICKSVTRITIGISSQDNFWVLRHRHEGSELMNASNLEHLARIEGFESAAEMREWFVANHKLRPGIGIEAEQIQW